MNRFRPGARQRWGTLIFVGLWLVGVMFSGWQPADASDPTTFGAAVGSAQTAATPTPISRQSTGTSRNPASGQSSYTSSYLPPTLTGPQATRVESVVDGSFEAGPPWPAWSQTSTNFGTPFCSVGPPFNCGNGSGTAGPRTGTYWAWFSGTTLPEDGSLQQVVSIPSGNTATLSFYLWYGNHSGNGASDYFRVLINGTQVFSITDAVTTYDAGYTRVAIDVSAFAGGNRTLRFEQHNNAALSPLNLNLDDVSVDVSPIGAPTPVIPEPSVIALFGSGLLALGWFGSRRRR